MEPRSVLSSSARIVVKVGSSSLAHPDLGLDRMRLNLLADVLSEQIRRGRQVVLVSSGAIAAGLAPLGTKQRPSDVATQQAIASVGQGLLIAAYAAAFGHHGLNVGQMLLTSQDLIQRSRYRNARRALDRLLELGIVPIINENDTVATDEIRFGDNDRLAALVGHLSESPAMLLLSDVDALYTAPPSQPGARRVEFVSSDRDLSGVRIGGAGSRVGTGGMETKLMSARMAAASGITVALTSLGLAKAALAGEDVGTVFTPTHRRRPPRMLWMAYASHPSGRIVLDDGAVNAVLHGKNSLLPPGATKVEGQFEAGEPVELVDRTGRSIARGFAEYSSEEMPHLLGRSTRELAEQFGPEYERALVDREEMVVFPWVEGP